MYGVKHQGSLVLAVDNSEQALEKARGF
jgi:hypothetical protein